MNQVNFFILLFLYTQMLGSEFIVAPKKRSVSKNELKERIGDGVRPIIDGCASIIEVVGGLLSNGDKVCSDLGEVLGVLGGMQKKMSAKADNLIRNKVPFKNASKQQLEETVIVMDEVATELNSKYNLIRDKKVLTGQLEDFKKMQSKISACYCLK